jgi:PTS system mannose-specific IIA component
VLTDVFGGTPCNLAISIINGSHIDVIAGVNLAMLIKLSSVRETSSLEQAVIQIQDAGRKQIYVVSQVLAPRSDRIEHVRQHELCHIAK